MQFEIVLCTFYSLGDERRFFQGLNDFEAIKNIQGAGRGLLIEIDIRCLSNDSARDLISLLWRYGIPLSPLKELATKKRFSWLNDKKRFWHKKMFL